MTRVTILAKADNAHQSMLVEKHLQSMLEGLKVDAKISGTVGCGWVQAALSGEDEIIALNYLAQEIGFCPERLENVKMFSTLEGRIAALNKKEDRLTVDVGVFAPNIVGVTIRLQYLQTQLIDGRKIALRRIAELFGLFEKTPLLVKILSVDHKNRSVEAIVAHRQLANFGDWMSSLLDRLIVLGTSRENVEYALRKTESERDVVTIESLGLFEQAVVCKLGTDAAGMIPRIGRILPYAAFSVFSPRRILGFLRDRSFPFTSP